MRQARERLFQTKNKIEKGNAKTTESRRHCSCVGSTLPSLTVVCLLSPFISLCHFYPFNRFSCETIIRVQNTVLCHMSKEGMYGGGVGPFSYFYSLTMTEERTIEETRRNIQPYFNTDAVFPEKSDERFSKARRYTNVEGCPRS